MSTTKFLPHECTTEMLATRVVTENPAMLAFIGSLESDDQRRRFMEFAHHILYAGFEEGLNRSRPQVSEVDKGRVLTHETTLYLQGYATARKDLTEQE